jgi:hypothetical protein
VREEAEYLFVEPNTLANGTLICPGLLDSDVLQELAAPRASVPVLVLERSPFRGFPLLSPDPSGGPASLEFEPLEVLFLVFAWLPERLMP